MVVLERQGDRSYFAGLFRKKIGIKPKAYLTQRRLNI